MVSSMLFSSSILDTETDKLGVQADNFCRETMKRNLAEDPERRGSNSTHTSSSLEECELLDRADETHSDQQAPTGSLQLTSSCILETETEKLGAQAVNFCQETIKIKLTEDPERRGSDTTHTSSSLECESLDMADEQSPTGSLQSTSSYQGYTLRDHEEYLDILTEKNGCRYWDVSHYLGVQSSIPNLTKDYISPLTQDQLKELYAGIVPSVDDSLDKEPLPVRTLCFRIRPDIESGAVMDVVQKVFGKKSIFKGDQNNIKSTVLKRQDGHFQCAVARLVAHDPAPFFIDAQLCTTKSDNMERQLVLRIHHVQDHAEALVEFGHLAAERKATNGESPSTAINLHLKEVSSILQLRSSTQKRNADVDAYGCSSPRCTPEETSLFLQENYKEEKSLKAGGTGEHFPALSSEDFSILQSSLPHCLLLWKYISHHQSSYAFHTMVDVHLGTACLDTLYLSQIRQLSRETMLEELCMVKTEIDENAQAAEDEYSNFTELLESTFKQHCTIGFPETIPPRVSLSEFYYSSSKYTPGISIIADMVSNDVAVDPANPASAADQVARRVYAEFSALDDKEQCGYLKKINKEMMARCAEIQGQYPKLIDRIENAKLLSVGAAAKRFCNFAKRAANHKGRVERSLTSNVPLLDFETSAGPCFITATHMLLVGRRCVFSRTFLFDLRAVEFKVPSPGFLRVVSEASGEVLHKFWSSMDANKVKMFLDTLKAHRKWRGDLVAKVLLEEQSPVLGEEQSQTPESCFLRVIP